jgi:hypothetical protein
LLKTALGVLILIYVIVYLVQRSGVRAAKAAETLVGLGFAAAIYKGSMLDWTEKGGKVTTTNFNSLQDFTSVPILFEKGQRYDFGNIWADKLVKK